MAKQTNAYNIFMKFQNINFVNLTQAADAKVDPSGQSTYMSRLVNRVVAWAPEHGAVRSAIDTRAGDTLIASEATAAWLDDGPDESSSGDANDETTMELTESPSKSIAC